MSSKLIKKENNEATLEFTISSEKFEDATQKAYLKLRGKFDIPGFRKGKAPRAIIESRYGKGVFFEEALDIAFPQEYKLALDEHNLEPVDRPNVDIKEVNEEGVTLEVTVTVRPEVKLGEYKGIEVEKIEYTLEEDAVDKRLEQMLDQNARFVNVTDRPVQEKDMVCIDFKGFVDGEAFEGGTAENYNLVIGSKTFIPGFEEQLIGANVSDEVDVNVTFPEEYHAENLAGKDALFKVTIKEIKEKQLPNLDDEFAKDVSEFDTLDELKEDIKKRLMEDQEKRAKMELRDKVVDKVVENATVDIPEAMIRTQIDSMVRDFDYQLRYQGLDIQKYLEFTNTKIEDLREQMKEEAYTRVKTGLVLEEITKVENIEVSQEELDKEIENMASMYRMELDKFKNTLKEEDKEYLKENVAIRKTVDMLVENAKVV
ncbi:trigger factor [Alkalithermobacter thermoalcaliphilus JW-YL-7 = DSM 7308]|uniref:Trigger factor n=1 Tax=Alkalithermobacter thermoalcaliphilus JW-YL-7 = DSM 7308 TaxID=1121328 RepID=A0A150FRW8_CLOPD|nr:Trigger factor [[Clostridium] paradoxum JW-YL-7 = DSM 7308]SHK36184.1 trigger factor [[Clostridium] paradoxum JW-YL-7 = DSM 7308]